MRLKVSGDKTEIRQSYLPALFPCTVKPLVDNGSSAVDQVVERMDEYYLSREDWDTIVKFGVDQNKDEVVEKYFGGDQGGVYEKASLGFALMRCRSLAHAAMELGKAPKKLAGGPAPDLEEASDVDDEIPDACDDEAEKREEDDISADKLISASKPKKAKTTTLMMASSLGARAKPKR
ncbi:RFC1-domain-containing protein [Imleria badia]|nr:RFC1-domain-containing protein [Imleria badia]